MNSCTQHLLHILHMNQKEANLVKTMSAKCGIGYTSGGHTGEDVPLYVYAPSNVNLPKGVIDNTEVAKYIADAMGVNLAETTSKMFIDITDRGTFDLTTKEFTTKSQAYPITCTSHLCISVY